MVQGLHHVCLNEGSTEIPQCSYNASTFQGRQQQALIRSHPSTSRRRNVMVTACLLPVNVMKASLLSKRTLRGARMRRDRVCPGSMCSAVVHVA